MKNYIKLSIYLMIIVSMFMCSNCFGVWWGTPGYEWALSKDLTSVKTQAQLNRDVTLSDYYSIILKYLSMKNVPFSNRMVQGITVEEIYNGALDGLVKDINSFISTDKELTPQQYRVVCELIDHGKKQMSDHSVHLYRDDLKNLTLYFDLAKYRAATLLTESKKIERQYKNDELYKLRNTKYAVSLKYGILPICADTISRESFLVLMHNILSGSSSTSDNIIRSFNEAQVLRGYENSLWLKKSMTYSEMFAFLHRFEIYDFSTSSSKATVTEQPSDEQ